MLIVTNANSIAMINRNILKEWRCDSIMKVGDKEIKCNKLLAKGNGFGIIAAEIKCSRCGTINKI